MTLYIINPNSTEAVTAGIRDAIAPFAAWGHPLRCETLAAGPPGIETDAHVAGVIAPLEEMMRTCPDASGFVIACFSDPGVSGFRRSFSVPVVGIREAAVAASVTVGDRFGVIAIGDASVRRHLVAFDAIGISARLAGDRPLGLSVVELTDPQRCLNRMIEVGKALRDEDSADVLIMGCAGMAQYRDAISDATGLPVIEPCQAAVAAALARITLGDRRYQRTDNAQ